MMAASPASVDLSKVRLPGLPRLRLSQGACTALHSILAARVG